MTKILEIENCDECPNYRTTTFGSYCHEIKMGVSGKGVSKKCSLPDKDTDYVSDEIRRGVKRKEKRDQRKIVLDPKDALDNAVEELQTEHGELRKK